MIHTITDIHKIVSKRDKEFDGVDVEHYWEKHVDTQIVSAATTGIYYIYVFNITESFAKALKEYGDTLGFQISCTKNYIRVEWPNV